MSAETIAEIIYALMIFSLILAVFRIVCWWIILKKGYERGWKILIPFVGEYALFKITWSGAVFFAEMLLSLIGIFLFILSGGALFNAIQARMIDMGIGSMAASLSFLGLSSMAEVLPSYFMLIAFILIASRRLIRLVRLYKLSGAFSHGFGFFLGLLFLQSVFLALLAFGSSSVYVGPNREISIEDL